MPVQDSDVTRRLEAALADRYRIGRVLGRGGMATVYRADDLRHHRQVAIKVLDPGLSEAIGPDRFRREIETVARLTHPHILPLYDSGVADGLFYYVMPYAEGDSLRDRLVRDKQLPVDDALRIAREAADALEYAHRGHIVHRDIKPENILLESGHAVIADFGIARAAEAADTETLTRTGVTLGTPAYMSPEQAAGRRDLDGRTDQYSLACVLYEMLTGQPPFSGPAVSLAHQHVHLAPRPVTELRTTVSAGVAAALQRALAKTPADRFGRIAEFAEALGREPTPAAGIPIPTPVTIPASTPHWRRIVVAAAVAGLLALVAVAAWKRWGPFAGRSESTPASVAAKKAWLMVAEFDGPADDSLLARAAREVVVGALDQSPVIGSVPREQVATALLHAGKPADTRLTPELARELAFRSRVRAVLEGSISRLGGRYTVTLRASDIEAGRQLLVMTDAANSENLLVSTLTRMAKRVREDLGEHAGALLTERHDETETPTASFEAYRRLVEATRLYRSGDYAGTITLCREAIAIDPGFASAWGSLAMGYLGVGKPDSAAYATEEALRHPGSLTPAYRLYLEARLQWHRGDIEGALAGFERVVRLYPGSPEALYALNQRITTLIACGRYREALANDDERAAFEVFPSDVALQVRATILIALGRLDEARAVAQRMQGDLREGVELNLALASAEWGRVDSLARAVGQATPSAPAVQRAFQGALVQVAAVHGEFAVAADLAHRSSESGFETRSPQYVRFPRSEAMLALVSGGPAPAVPSWLARDTTASALITRAFFAGTAGDTVYARRLLNDLRTRSTTRFGTHGATPEFLEALIAFRAGRWWDVVRLLAEPARDGRDRGATRIDRIGVVPERWLVAQAYERLAQPDSAIVFYRGLLGPDMTTRIAWSFAHQRLAVLEARLGRRAEAEADLAVLERDFTKPDPRLRALLDEARDAVRNPRAASGAVADRN